MRLDVTAIGGIIFGVLALVTGFVLEGGRAGALLQGTAALIVFGGTIGATAVSFSVDELKKVPTLFRMGLTRKKFDPIVLIDQLARYADIARRQQPLALEPEIELTHDEFLSKGLQLIVDNADPTLMRQMLESDIYARYSQQKMGASIFEQAGGYAPTMGIVGTIMGLVHVLGELSGNPNDLASAIGLAFIATLYGVSSANLLWLPMATNLKNKAKHDLLMRQISLEGLLAISQGMAPSLLKDKLMTIIRPSGSPAAQDTTSHAEGDSEAKSGAQEAS
ncbi:chemotaxis protein MotA [Sulfobacillus thermosulfidooxidans DSM 9293]|uniref:Chemotaxis protein MotA n=1 Tax=Sulfobacillus thermosulfidooxidans (strain DSM 9293 / VKM B-1269 / AT-1) TaxID=929705 RepID=A0A1W1WE32_SULTA|nr:MotA/TolQ/ExbB proton channel family protein [Sulfobacillus thermosulfidooxidans]SMC04554.1 chemotaxis protein MotA [Sulfobacillus thermosulfidooxidans DSM 9293]